MRKNMKKVTSAILVIVLALTFFPSLAITAKAAEQRTFSRALYFQEGALYLGTKITGTLIDDLDGWNFDGATNTLTLNNLNMFVDILAYPGGGNCALSFNNSGNPLTLILVGDNSITTNGEYALTFTYVTDMTIEGNGSLNLLAEGNKGRGLSISAAGTVTVKDNVTITAESKGKDTSIGIGIGCPEFIMEGGTLNAIATRQLVASYSYGFYLARDEIAGSFVMTGGEIYAQGYNAAVFLDGVMDWDTYEPSITTSPNISVKGNDGDGNYTVSGEFTSSTTAWDGKSSAGRYAVYKDAVDPWPNEFYGNWSNYYDLIRSRTLHDVRLKPYTGGTLVINPNNGIYDGKLTNRGDVGETLVIKTPARDGYRFDGWQHEGGGSFSNSVYSFGFTDGTLTAQWTEVTTAVIDNTQSTNITVTSPNLDEVYDRVVTSADTGTAVKLSLNVNDITVQTPETDAIKAAANNGSEVYFFDVTLVKSINDGGNTTNTILTNVPVPVEIHIALTSDLAGKSYYKVYRYHDNVAEQISNDPRNQEHYVVDVLNSEIIDLLRNSKSDGNTVKIADTRKQIETQAKTSSAVTITFR